MPAFTPIPESHLKVWAKMQVPVAEVKADFGAAGRADQFHVMLPAKKIGPVETSAVPQDVINKLREEETAEMVRRTEQLMHLEYMEEVEEKKRLMEQQEAMRTIKRDSKRPEQRLVLEEVQPAAQGSMSLSSPCNSSPAKSPVRSRLPALKSLKNRKGSAES